MPNTTTTAVGSPSRRLSPPFPPVIGRNLAIGIAIALAYIVAARLGFRAAFMAEQVTTVWAPTGIAMAALLLWGTRLWPAVWLGAFAVNVATNAPWWAAVIVATGNTLEAVVTALALRAWPHFDRTLRRVSDVMVFVGVGPILCTTISATIGVITLCVAAAQPWERFATLWFDWWLGDALGGLVVAPAIITVLPWSSWSRHESARVAMFVGGTMVVTQVAFGRLLGLGAHPLEYVVFPAVVAAAVTGGVRASSLVVLGASAVTIWNTLHGTGPFAAEIHRTLIRLQTFTGVLAGTGLLLAAAIAERKESERRESAAAAVLRRREEMLQLAQRAGGVATFEWDFDRQVAHCSAEFFRIFGLPETQGVIRSSEWAQFVHPADRDRITAHLRGVLDGSEAGAADYRIVRGDGTERWVSYTGELQRTRAGDRLLGTVVDITERKRIESALEDAKNTAESANQLKDQFLATLSHELRTPLNAILGYARMLKTDAIALDKRRHAVDVIERNAVAQSQLVEDLLDMSRISTGRIRLEPSRVAIATVLLDALEGVRPAADAKRIALDIHLDPLAGVVNADRTRLQQVFWNILTNAVKFTGEEGAVVAILRSHGAHVEVSIADTGAGISVDFLPFVFEPFRQADARPARAHGGLGLGLAISKQIVELHGGTIHASSAGPGLGATFVVRLPRLQESDAAPAPG